MTPKRFIGTWLILAALTLAANVAFIALIVYVVKAVWRS